MRLSENQTLAEKSAQDVLDFIKEHNMSPGDKLPTEAELVELLGVGRNTVREALRLLMSRNIIVIRQGAGAFVSEKNGVADDPFGFSMVEDREKLTKDLLQIRTMIEPKIAALAAQNRTEEDLELLKKALLDVERVMFEKQSYAKEDSVFHARIADCTHNMIMANLIPVITQGVEVFSGTVKEQEYQQTLLSHRAIVDAIQERKAVEAERAMHYHLLYNYNRYSE